MRHTTTAVLAVVAAVLSNFTSSFGVLASGVDDHAVVLGAHDQFVSFLDAFGPIVPLLMVFSL